MGAEEHQSTAIDDPRVALILEAFAPRSLILLVETPYQAAPVGTGFLISDDGKFITAQHVAEELKERVDGAHGLVAEVKAVLMSGEAARTVQVTKLWVNAEESESTDITVGRLAPRGTMPSLDGFSVADQPPTVGEEVGILGFSGLPEMLSNEGGPWFQLEVNVKLVTTRITKLHPAGYTHVRGPVFEMEGTIDSGMSGGPIIRLATCEVIGIASYSPNAGQHSPYCFGSVVEPSGLSRVAWG